ncbi:family 43 glycosylhydrolase [Knoellia sp. CPCC 206453]|uniref:family 43 glycosylhydrolase n=1 Tax=Knoellia pratensis TaxID=3404796 RepID=UPI003609B610
MSTRMRAACATFASMLIAVGVALPAQAEDPRFHDTGLTFADPGFIETPEGVTIHGTGGVELDDGTVGAFPAATALSYDGTYSLQPPGASLPVLPDWVGLAPTMGRRLWAPSVIEVNGTYVMYYTAWNGDKKRNCIGIATASLVDGPFVEEGEPLCAPSGAGTKAEAIDPSAYISVEGRCYMLFKTSQNKNRENFKIWAQKMSTNCVTPQEESPRVKVKSKNRIEAPFILNPSEVGGSVYMFVSRKNFATCDYNIEVWRADEMWDGDFTKERVLLNQENSGLCGPGGATVIDSKEEGTRIAFHSWDVPDPSNPATVLDPATTPRKTWTAKISWDKKGRPRIS